MIFNGILMAINPCTLLLLLLLSFSTSPCNAQTESSLRARGRYESQSITCYGGEDYIEESLRGLSDDAREEQRRLGYQTLAQICARPPVMAYCAAGYNPPGSLFFDGLAALYPVDVHDIMIEILEHMLQTCAARCTCTTIPEALPLMQERLNTPPYQPPGLDKWDFDSMSALSLTLNSELIGTFPGFSRRIVTYYGFSRIFRPGQELYDSLPLPRSISPLQFKYVGSLHNKPVCDGVNLFDEMPFELYHFLHMDVPPSQQLTASQICLHRFYGGGDTNNGGVCLKLFADLSYVRFPKIYKSPSLTPDFYAAPIPLVVRLNLDGLEMFCRAFCRCKQGGSKESRARAKQTWERFRGPKYKKNTLADKFSKALDSFKSGSKNAARKSSYFFGSLCKAKENCARDQVCQVTSQQVDPVNFDPRLSTGVCVDAFSNSHQSPAELGLSGRDAQTLQLCACNSTYVSARCCESKDGIVWEPPEFKAGELPFELA